MHSKLILSLASLFTLTACNPTGKPTYPERRGGRGEACLVTNDCKEPLLCFGGRCLDEELAFEPTSKVCVAAECIDSSDCCPPLTKDQQERCAEYSAACDSDPDAVDCYFYRSDCECTRECVNHSCSFQPACISSDECASGSCKDGRCRECSKDSQCGDGYTCEQNQCQLGCRRDEECGPLAQCDDGRCKDRPCASDRECALLLYARDAVCKDGLCGVPCRNDAQCSGTRELSTCSGGLCKFVGCEDNFECAASTPGPLSLCLSQAEANKVR